MSIQSKLLVMLLVTSILSAAVVGAIGFNSGRTSLRASVFERLTEIDAGLRWRSAVRRAPSSKTTIWDAGPAGLRAR